MIDHITTFLGAIEQGDPQAVRSVYASDARLITMTPNTFNTDEGVDAIAARLEDWFLSWEERPGFSFLSTIRDGNRTFVEFERTSTYEGAQWVVRQAHVMDVAPDGIREHRIYCCGPREGKPDLAAAYEGAR